ncbi:MAG: transposase [Streptosporangiaceae bacterium]|jgi:DDE superfamily endonuclease
MPVAPGSRSSSVRHSAKRSRICWMLALDVSNWLRPGAATSPDRLFCHVYGRGKGQAQMIPGWPY